MRRTKRSGRTLGISTTGALLLLFLQGCARLPFGNHAEGAAADASGVPPQTIAGTSVTESGVGLSPSSTVTISGVPALPKKIVTPIPPNGPAPQGGQIGEAAHTSPLAPNPVTTIPVGATSVVNAEINRFVFHSAAERAIYEKAAAGFPNFCQDWQRMLHDRETNNLAHLTWQPRNGVITSTYTGYGQVETCETKESVEGVPIGKISYDEMVYSLSGKSADEARRTQPQIVHQVHTLEIFSWDKGKWFY